MFVNPAEGSDVCRTLLHIYRDHAVCVKIAPKRASHFWSTPGAKARLRHEVEGTGARCPHHG